MVSPDHAGALPLRPTEPVSRSTKSSSACAFRCCNADHSVARRLLFALSPAVEGLTVDPERIGAMGLAR